MCSHPALSRTVYLNAVVLSCSQLSWINSLVYLGFSWVLVTVCVFLLPVGGTAASGNSMIATLTRVMNMFFSLASQCEFPLFWCMLREGIHMHGVTLGRHSVLPWTSCLGEGGVLLLKPWGLRGWPCGWIEDWIWTLACGAWGLRSDGGPPDVLRVWKKLGYGAWTSLEYGVFYPFYLSSTLQSGATITECWVSFKDLYLLRLWAILFFSCEVC